MSGMALAQVGGYSIIQMVITIIILCGVAGIVVIVMRQTGIQIPNWIWAILGILFVCFVAIFAVKFLASMG